MTTPTYGGAPSNARPHHVPENHWLDMRQEPEKARVVVRGKEKDRKPVDPPPIVQLKVSDPYNDTCSYLHNPYYFCACTLWDAELDQPKRPEVTPGAPPPEALQGQLVSSLHRLKDFDNTEQGFFVFSDVSVGIIGRFRLRFSVYEYRPQHGDCVFLKSQLSHPFDVVAPKDWDGVRESTALSRSFADQGVRIRLRKESRHSSKRAYSAQQGGPSLAPQTPLRPHPSGTGSYGSAASSQDGVGAAQDERAFKRQRSYPNSTAAGGYMAPTTQAWQQNAMYAPVAGQNLPYAQQQQQQQQHPYNYGGAAPYSQYQSQQQQQATQPSSFVSGYPSPHQSASQPQYQAQTTRGFMPPQAGYVTAPGTVYSNPQQYAGVAGKYPAQSSSYQAQQQPATQSSMVGYSTQPQGSPYPSTSTYAASQQQAPQPQSRSGYPMATQPSSHSQYGMGPTQVPYRQGPPSGSSGQPQSHEDLDEMMRRQGRPMANPSTTPRLNPIHGAGGPGADLPVQTTETDDPHTPSHMHAAMQRRQQHPSSATHTPGGVGEA